SFPAKNEVLEASSIAQKLLEHFTDCIGVTMFRTAELEEWISLGQILSTILRPALIPSVRGVEIAGSKKVVNPLK
ncbi:MAG TPA: hypothetical protein VLA12_02085, partial [Planctomycetaceae bacterium]|nr:hypothetical protein [Planctomycetaceae bacterium]